MICPSLKLITLIIIIIIIIIIFGESTNYEALHYGTFFIFLLLPLTGSNILNPLFSDSFNLCYSIGAVKLSFMPQKTIKL
jgi:hypothetical protein